eukprot:14787468-Alexandrium_andersonii.AAC.1
MDRPIWPEAVLARPLAIMGTEGISCSLPCRTVLAIRRPPNSNHKFSRAQMVEWRSAERCLRDTNSNGLSVCCRGAMRMS